MIRKLLLISLFLRLSTASCPDAQVVYPCECINNSIGCVGITTELNLKTLFEKINSNVPNGEKNFGSFHLEKTNVNELPANVFGEITFESIQLFHNPNLVYIHPLAFTRSSFHLKRFIVESTPLSNAGTKEKDIFDALSRCPDLEMIRLIATNLTSIPDHAFHPINGEFNKLTSIYTDESPIKSIGEFAFYYMPSITMLSMTRNKFSEIKKNTFTIKTRNEERLELFLQDVPLTETSFDVLSLINFRRPVRIRLFSNKMTTLYEAVFKPFFELYPNNLIDIEGNNIQCDCRIKWIFDEEDYYYTKISGAYNLWRCELKDC